MGNRKWEMGALTPSQPISDFPFPISAVRLDNVSRWYANVVAVNNVTCEIGPGITGLLGPNGAGKTTVLHMMAGLLRPSSGEVRVGDYTPSSNPRSEEHTSELQSQSNLVCRLLLEKKNQLQRT